MNESLRMFEADLDVVAPRITLRESLDRVRDAIPSPTSHCVATRCERSACSAAISSTSRSVVWTIARPSGFLEAAKPWDQSACLSETQPGRGLMAFPDSVRYAIRGLRRSPGFSAAVILTLGLGLGANAAMFNVVDQLMFRPYAYMRDPSSVHRVYLRMPGRMRLLTRESFPYARYLDLRNWTTSFSQTAAFFPTDAAVGSGDAVRKRPIVAVSASFFDFFDARPELGRYFVAAEDTTPSGAFVA